jgi:ABC-type branched-subunit amino acid transport system ATPase component
VLLDGVDVTRASPDARARRGLGRSFQRLSLFDSLTVGENVLMGFEARAAGRNPLRQVLTTRQATSEGRDAVDQALRRCGLSEMADRFAGDLPTGQRRLVDLARVLAGGFDVLLLDEPSSGLDPDETERFGRILRRLADDGAAMLLVEHDMRLVLSVCAHLHVLDFGRTIAEGAPAEVVASPEVRAAYLGTAKAGQPC